MARVVVGVAVGVGLLLAAASAGAQTIGYTASVFVARSTFDTDRATSLYLFNGADLTAGPLRVAASVPLVRQRITPLDSLTDPAASREATTSVGFGDPLIRVDVRVVDDRRRGFQLAAAGSIKPALVDPDGGLGTGVSDYAAGLSAFKTIRRTAILADALYWKYGDPEGVEFENSWSYSLGVGRPIGGSSWSTLVSVAGFSAIAGTPAPLLLNIGLLTLTGPHQSLAITAGVGLTSSASDFSIGTSWRTQR
jgi:hypothetical protein